MIDPDYYGVAGYGNVGVGSLPGVAVPHLIDGSMTLCGRRWGLKIDRDPPKDYARWAKEVCGPCRRVERRRNGNGSFRAG